jgi:intracellular sulfur oxidation DsrE/DsrF family protein
VSRRHVLAGGIGAVIAAAAQPANAVAGAVSVDGPDRWLEDIHAATRQFFDVSAHQNGAFLGYVHNYFTAFTEAYGVRATDIAAAVGLRGSAVALALGDDAWTQYSLGQQLGIYDLTSAGPMSSNRFVAGLGSGGESIRGLQARGATFLACRNSLLGLSAALAAGSGADGDAVYADLRRSLLPGVFLVPAMVAAMNRAQVHGFTYAAYV